MRIAAVIFVALLTGCASPEKDWELATRDDTKETYLEFLAKHPESEQAQLARVRIQELQVISAWGRAEFKDDVEAYTAFIDKHPDSEFTAAAKNRVSEIERDTQWEFASESGSMEALEGFLATYPGAPQRSDAEALLTELKLAELAAIEAAKPKERPGAFRLQLAAFRTPEAADTELRRLVKLFPNQLLGPLRIETPADRNNGGRMFLIKTVPMNAEEARATCQRLKDRGQECLVINR
jgi:hypothetical protein